MEQQGFVHFFACIALSNDASLALHKKRGYKQVAHFPKIGYKFDRWHDSVWLQKLLDKPIHPLKKYQKRRLNYEK